MNTLDYFFGYQDYKIVENDNAYVLSILSPARDLKDFKVEVKHNKLIVSAEKGTNFSFASFKKSYELPDNVNAEAITASYKSGILEIKVPKAEGSDRTLIIEIKGE